MKITDLEKPARPLRVIQFGGGVFLRGFFDWMLAKANASGKFSGDAVIIRSRTHGTDPLAAQDFRYTHIAEDGERRDVTLVDCIRGSMDPGEKGKYEDFLRLAENPDTDIIVSNTTEAGIVYEYCEKPEKAAPATYPARLTALLYRRFEKKMGGFLILPCELIDRNGDALRDTVLRHAADWNLGTDFEKYIEKECSFRNTLVDRIVSGAPRGELPVVLPYEDALVNTSEFFHLWVIEGAEDPRLPFARLGMNVKWVPDVDAYHTLKVRILNGAHTSMIPYALLLGVETVGECMKNDILRPFLTRCLFDEILTSLDFDRDEAKAYAEEVLRRFENPRICHLCSAISLNSVSKFRVRVLPSILAYREKFGSLPRNLIFSFSRLIRFYRMGEPRDDETVIRKMREGCVRDLLADTSLWGEDISFLYEAVSAAMKME